MPTLRNLQEALQAYVIENDLGVQNEILSPKNMAVVDRLHVYRNAYYLRLVEVLEGDFPALREIVGKEAFSSLVRNYLDAYPSHHFSIRNVGRHLAKFLKNTADCDPCYVELAHFEWAIHQALLERDEAALTLDHLATIPSEQWNEMRLKLHPSVHVLCCRYNTLERWQSIDQEGKDIHPALLSEPLTHLIWRKDREIYFCSITAEQTYLLDGIRKEETFGALCEMMLEHFSESEVIPWVANTLQRWVQEGMLSNTLP